MRIAVMIIGIALSVVMAVQNSLVFVIGAVAESTETAAAGVVSLFVAFVMFVAAAFALGLPLVSTVLFLGIGVFALGIAVVAGFGDLGLWAVVSLILGAMAFIGWRGKRRTDLQARLEREEHRALLTRVASYAERTPQ